MSAQCELPDVRTHTLTSEQGQLCGPGKGDLAMLPLARIISAHA